MKIANIVEELNNVFPDKFYIGGSFARNEILGKPHNFHSDIDFYTNLSITRAGFIKVLENIIFEGKDITVYPNMGLNEYKMPSIRKRVEIASEGVTDMDFIFLDPEVKDVGAYLLKNQASALSECYIKPDFRTLSQFTSRILGFKKASDRFYQVTGGNTLRINKNLCTPGHYKKLKALAEKYNLTIEI